MSRDHDWGPSVDLFLNQADHERFHNAIHEILARELPREFLGYGTHFSDYVEPDGRVTGQLTVTPEGSPIQHRVRTMTLYSFFQGYLNLDLDAPLTPADWLTFPAQHLRTITGGAVFHDDLGLNSIRARLVWFPRDVWLYMLTAGWTRIAQEEHLMPRAGHAGDELGSSIIGGRLIRDIMWLCFLMARQYPPYAKWFGTAFSRLPAAREMMPHLRGAQLAGTWQERERHLSTAYENLAHMHNALNITPPLSTTVSPFFGRPFLVIWGGRFADALLAQVDDADVRRIAAKTLIGSIDQFIDSTDGLDPKLRLAWKAAYG